LNSEYEDEQIASFLEGEENFEDGEIQANDNEYPEEEPLGFWDKKEVAGGNSPLAGTPDGLAGPATAGFNFMFDDIGTILDKDASTQDKMLASSFMFFKPLKLADRGHDLYKTSRKARKASKGGDKTNHGNYRANQRGFNNDKIDDIVNNYSQKVYQSGGRTVYAKKSGKYYDVIIKNKNNEIITTVGGDSKSLKTWKDVTKMLSNNGGYTSLPMD